MKKRHNAWLAFVFNPLVILIYSIVCYYLAFLAQYGGVARRAPVILAGSFILFFWFAWCLFRYIKHRNESQDLPFGEETSRGFDILSTWWNAIALILFVSITFTAGTTIYQSAINSQGKLAFYINHWKNTRKMTFDHDNLYEDGLEGLFEDIQEEILLPEELYAENVFELEFNEDGQITSVYSFLYGLNEENETESFLIDYDRSKSDDITVHLNGHADPAYDEQMKLQPLMDIADSIPVEEVVSQWEEESFGIYYAGVRDWGYNTDGIVSVDEDGNLEKLETAYTQLIGYTASVHSPENESLTPMRFVKIDPQLANEQAQTAEVMEANTDTFFLNQTLGYRLTVADAALGSRFYTLEQSTDGGKTWELLNPDPFLGTLGTASGLVFMDEDLGFIGLSKSGGSYAMLYRTIDGGKTFERVEIPAVEVPLIATDTTHAPFDFPEMPYAGNDKLLMMVNQGQDGDHNGGTRALFQSDDGMTWEFVEEVR